MSVNRQRLSGKFFALALTSSLLVAYVFASERLAVQLDHPVNIKVPTISTVVSDPSTKNVTTAQNGRLNSALPSSAVQVSGDVPESIVQGVAEAVGTVPGINELVVMNALNGSGYTVSATVDLSENAAEKADVWTPAVQEDMNRYFQGVFADSLNVQNAEVYFTLGGNIVAGAGLGQAAYQSMVANVSTNAPSFAKAIAELPVVSQDGSNDSWFEEQTTSPIQP